MQILLRARHLCTRTASFPGVRSSLARALRDEFAIFEPNELQAKALPIALDGRDLIVCGSAGRRSCASRRRSSPSRATTTVLASRARWAR